MEGDEERTSLLDEPTDPGHGDEAVGELSQGLREPGLHVLRLLPLHAKSTLGEPVEISRRRTPRLLKRYFMMPMGNERYCLIDPEGPIELKGEWTQQDHSVCVAVVSFVGGFVSLAIVEVATGGVGNVAAYFVGGAGALFGGIAGHLGAAADTAAIVAAWTLPAALGQEAAYDEEHSELGRRPRDAVARSPGAWLPRARGYNRLEPLSATVPDLPGRCFHHTTLALRDSPEGEPAALLAGGDGDVHRLHDHAAGLVFPASSRRGQDGPCVALLTPHHGGAGVDCDRP